MKKYKIILNGQNFIMKTAEGSEKCGFYTTKYVEAENYTEAEKAAVESVRNDDELKKGVLNERDNQPLIYIEKIEELESFDHLKALGEGYAFYPEKD
ncbi:MAG: hypothetical protein JSV21_00335 [Nitrospirota bacterium]|nr:MAG: hypothetical protein JSV21_00335 [Nitrospirota bacterium]